MTTLVRFTLAASIVLLAPAALAADKASGKVTCDQDSFDVKYAWLVRAPNVVWGLAHGKDDLYDPKAPTMLRLYFSDQDKTSEIKACVNLSCITGVFDNYLYVDVSDPKDTKELWYQTNIPSENRSCNSGEERTVLKLRTQQPDHLAGKLDLKKMLGDTEMERWDVDFDLKLTTTVKTEYQYEN